MCVFTVPVGCEQPWRGVSCTRRKAHIPTVPLLPLRTQEHSKTISNLHFFHGFLLTTAVNSDCLLYNIPTFLSARTSLSPQQSCSMRIDTHWVHFCFRHHSGLNLEPVLSLRSAFTVTLETAQPPHLYFMYWAAANMMAWTKRYADVPNKVTNE